MCNPFRYELNLARFFRQNSPASPYLLNIEKILSCSSEPLTVAKFNPGYFAHRISPSAYVIFWLVNPNHTLTGGQLETRGLVKSTKSALSTFIGSEEYPLVKVVFGVGVGTVGVGLLFDSIVETETRQSVLFVCSGFWLINIMLIITT